MKNSYGLCRKCKGVNVEELKEEILKLDPNASFDVKCHSNCGPGINETFIKLNDKFYIGEDTEEVIEQLEEDLYE